MVPPLPIPPIASLDPIAAATIVATLGAALFGYLAAARRATGRIATSEASDLWREADALRTEYKAQADAARAENDFLRKQMEDLRRQHAEEVGQLRERCAKLEQKIREMEAADEPPPHLA